MPQATAPMTIDGKPYVLEFDEFALRFKHAAAGPPAGRRRADHRHLRRDASRGSSPTCASRSISAKTTPRRRATPAPSTPAQNYAAHYCAIPREVDPEIVACSFINSGLRIFNITKPRHPREVAYYVAPPEQGLSNAGMPSNYAYSQPAFAPGRREVWYTDVISGFHALRLNRRAWPNPTKRRGVPAPTPARTARDGGAGGG